jgi:phosphate transport system protein
MSDDNPQPPGIDVELPALERHLLSLANIVENAFADAIVALIEGDSSVAREAQREDYKAHQAWLQADSMAMDLLSSGELNLRQVRFVSAGVKIALDLKVMADEGIRISNLMGACPGGGAAPGSCTELLPEMAEMAQTMFGDSVDAFVNRDGTEAESQTLVFRKLSSLHEDLVSRVNAELKSAEEIDAEMATSLVLVSRSLEIIGERALDIASHVARLYPPEEEAETEEVE